MFENFEILNTPAPELKITAWFQEQTTEITVVADYSNIPFIVCLEMCQEKVDEWIGSL